jgi:hypothetical protein
MLIVIAALSLLGATVSLLVPGGVLLAPLLVEPPCSRSPGATAASRTARCASTTRR